MDKIIPIHRFTVFTPTYNRAHTLPRVYESLKKQTFKDFEWLVVDDGSSDGTEGLIKKWQAEDQITIRYFYQNNLGKHIAFNHGVQESKGELFLTFDSDDYCVPHALERFDYHWNNIPADESDRFSGITCLCMDSEGKIIGTRFPDTVFDSDPVTMATKYGVRGEKWGFHQTNILRKFPFPEFPGEYFVPEGLVWNRIASKYMIRYVDEPLRTYIEQDAGLSATFARFTRNPSGVILYYLEYAQLKLPLRHRMKAIINYFRYSAHAGIKPTVALRKLSSFTEGLMLLPAGIIFYFADRCASRK